MKRNFIILIFLVFVLTSCFSKTDNLSNSGSILNGSGTITSTGNLVLSGSLIPTGSGAIIEKELTIEDKINLLLSEKEVLKKLKNDGEYKEEVSRIESYHSNNAFYEFYILNSIKKSNIAECDSINIEDKKSLCKELYENYSDESKVIEIYGKYDEDKEFAKNMYNTFKNLSSNNSTCENNDIFQYLSCKKIFDKDFDVNDAYIKYSRLIYSNIYDVKKYKDDILKEWKLDNGISNLIDTISIDTGKELDESNK